MKYFLVLLTIFLFANCSQEEKHTFTLQGRIQNPVRNYIILNQENDIERKESIVIDTLFLDESGKFKSDFNTAPHFYSLVINEDEVVPLILDKGQIVTIEIRSSGKKVTGSNDTDLFMEYEKFRAASLERLVKTIRKEIAVESATEHPDPIKIDSLGKLEISNYDLHLAELNSFIKEKMGTSIALYPTSIRWKGEENLKFYDSIVSNFEKAHSNLSVSKALREKVTRLQQTSVGGIAPDIEMNTKDGDIVSLYSINKRYTLVEFWASWCGPCRRESAVLKNLYSKYNNKGFEIYGISLDTNKKQWLGALEKDKRTWTNVSTLEGFKTPAAYTYAVTALPMSYLIDSDGKLIAKDIHGEELEKLVDELMRD
jgi:thiol-disulfide isomerase/thioredoxin